MKNRILTQKNKILTSVCLLMAFFFTVPVSAQNNGTGGNPCNTSQPRPITGNQHPCPGSLETYCIDNDRNYTSFVWDVPRAHAGNPPTGWEIVSGQGTECVTVRVGTKSGTMKVTVNDPICGTKVATLPVKPSRGFIVDVMGPDTVCVGVSQTFTAQVADSLGQGNGNGNVKGSFNYTWMVPAGWTITSGAGSQSITVTPGATSGTVTVTADFVAQGNGNGNGNNGNGVGNFKEYCNTTASDGLNVYADSNCGTNPCPITAVINGPETICLFSDDPFTYTVTATAGATYTWSIVNASISSGQGTNSVEVIADVDAGPGSITVIVATNCGSKTTTFNFDVVEDCDLINPLPVELINFTGAASSEGVALNWATASEKNNDRFEIERSADGRSFEKVAIVKGHGTSNVKNAYNFLDKTPMAGLNYYRLRQVDFNGTTEFSKTIAVDSRKVTDNPVTLYPNPVTDGNFNIRMKATGQPVTIQIMDISGRMINSQTITNNGEVAIDGKALGMKPGIYLINVKAGNAVTVQKLMMK